MFNFVRARFEGLTATVTGVDHPSIFSQPAPSACYGKAAQLPPLRSIVSFDEESGSTLVINLGGEDKFAPEIEIGSAPPSTEEEKW